MGFDIQAALRDLYTYKEVWRLIREFAAAWAEPIKESDDVSDAELDAVEDRFRVRLPEVVRQGYQLIGCHPDLTSRNGYLYELDELEYEPTDGMLTFRCTHQATAFFTVRLRPWSDDPPVYLDHDLTEPYVDRFSISLVEMVLWESVEAGDHTDCRGLTDYDGDLLTGLMPVSRLLPPMMWNEGLYASRDILLRQRRDLVTISARTDEALDEFRRAHPGDWAGREPAGH
jgi:hypothetical protein